jgi:hypothetical protein
VHDDMAIIFPELLPRRPRTLPPRPSKSLQARKREAAKQP